MDINFVLRLKSKSGELNDLKFRLEKFRKSKEKALTQHRALPCNSETLACNSETAPCNSETLLFSCNSETQPQFSCLFK